MLAQGGVFDLTSAANNFTFRTEAGAFATSCASQTGVNDAFLMLTDAPCVASEATGFQWGLGSSARSDPFRFLADSIAPGQTAATDYFEGAPTGGAYSFDFGNGYLATAVPQAGSGVPEPAMTGLLGWGLLGLFLARTPARRKRR